MGSACSSANEVQPNPNLDKQTPDKNGRADQKSDVAMHKILLLGPGDSGKTTLFKQLSTLFGRPMTEADRRTYVPVVANNVINAMKALCEVVDKYGGLQSPEAVAARSFVENELKGDEELDEKMGEQLKLLWNDKNIQETFAKHGTEFQLPESTKYFMDKLDEICKKGAYLPSEQDVLRSRVRTTGIVDAVFTVDNAPLFKMFDIGGQKNERKKWPHCFEHVSAVIFVAAISEYDQVLHEDEKTNRLVESLNLWEEIVNGKWFRDTPVLLFLSKRDVFLEKCTVSPMDKHFPDAPRVEMDAKTQEAWVRQQFESRSKQPERKLVVHSLNCVDPASVAVTVHSIRDAIAGRPVKGAKDA